MVGKEKLFSIGNSEKEIPNHSNPTPFTQISLQFKQENKQNLEPRAKIFGDFEKLILCSQFFINVVVISVFLVLLKRDKERA